MIFLVTFEFPFATLNQKEMSWGNAEELIKKKQMLVKRMTLKTTEANDTQFTDIWNIPTTYLEEMAETWKAIHAIMENTQTRLAASQVHNRTPAIRKAMSPSLVIAGGDRLAQEYSYGTAPKGLDEDSEIESFPIYAPLITEGNRSWSYVDNIARALGETRLPKNSKPNGPVYKDIVNLRNREKH